MKTIILAAVAAVALAGNGFAYSPRPMGAAAVTQTADSATQHRLQPAAKLAAGDEGQAKARQSASADEGQAKARQSASADEGQAKAYRSAAADSGMIAQRSQG
jgi:hypothetical protein